MPPNSTLWRILVSGSLYLIWKLRCERVIGVIEYSANADWTLPVKAVQAKWTTPSPRSWHSTAIWPGAMRGAP
ncbi:hypothetical protein C8Q72DRAFT_834005 [Fomitopsis betulina]|nr:hypothetical protein C8Q72DRAFT_834005 [Fomitopsis betulina]